MNVDGISTVTQLQLQNNPKPPGEQLVKNTQDNTNPANNGAMSDQVQLQISIPRQTLDTLQKIGGITEILNDTAKSLRATGNGLSASADIAAKMQTTLEKIVKNYPPFAIDDPERKDIIMSYSALRKEVEKLMVPQPPPPVYEKVQSLWKELFGQSQAGTIATPNLGEKASDTVVADATKHLVATGNAISAMHAAIGASL